MVAAYLMLVETAKTLFYRHAASGRVLGVNPGSRERTVRRWSARWTHPGHGRAA
jgi:hypothetical protein